ncbi:MAG: hypothetical protein PVG65_00820 [Candidatus Thorarchaeota archaeon]|jgi:hypothetical protein
MKKFLLSLVLLFSILVASFSFSLTGSELILKNTLDRNLLVRVEWVNHPYGCWFDGWYLRCEHYIGVGNMYVYGKKYERGGVEWIGGEWIFDLKDYKIGSKFKIYWIEKEKILTVHKFTLVRESKQIISEPNKTLQINGR